MRRRHDVLFVGMVFAVALCASFEGVALASCPSVWQSVDPQVNVPVNVDASNAATITLDGGVAYRVWAVGRSYHAPAGCGRYTDVMAASAYGDGNVFTIPIEGDTVFLPPSGTPGTRTVALFFVEFGSGFLGDNTGSTTVHFQPLCGGTVLSATVSPVSNIVCNLNGSDAASIPIARQNAYMVFANGKSQYTGVLGYYRSVFLCAQWGCDTYLKAVPIDGNAPLELPGGGYVAADPVYLWFPEFGSGYLGDNHGSTSVGFVPVGTTVYDAFQEYSGTQGGATGVWKYEYEQNGYHDLSWLTSACWNDPAYGSSGGYGWIIDTPGCLPGIIKPLTGGRLTGHPGHLGGQSGYGASLKWTAPASNSIAHVMAEFRLAGVRGGDGVKFVLTKNGVGLDSLEVAYSDTTLHTFERTVSVVAGDAMRFIGRPRGDNYYDRFNFNVWVEFPPSPTAVGEPQAGVGAVEPILRVSPNPFRSTATVFLRSTPSDRTNASLEVYDLAGRMVRRIPGSAFGGDGREVTWDGRDESGSRVSSGVYMMRLRSGSQVSKGKVMLLH